MWYKEKVVGGCMKTTVREITWLVFCHVLFQLSVIDRRTFEKGMVLPIMIDSIYLFTDVL